MPLQLYSFSDLVNLQASSMEALAGQNIDFSQGSDFLAFVESNAGNSLWLQAIVTNLLAVARLTTSHGNDVDTFVEQFGLTRVPASPSSGQVTFSRYTPTYQAVILVGSLVYCVANGVSYQVTVDTTNPIYNPSLNGYVILATVTSGTVPVTALTAGTISNVLANQINTISSVIPNVDTVTNLVAFTNGVNQQTDDQLKAYFVLYLDSLSKATYQALAAAIISVQGVERYVLVENQDLDTTQHLGYFYAIIDDGSGNASSELKGNVQAALYAVRGLTIQFSVFGPVKFFVDVVAHVFTDGSQPDATVQTNVIDALQTYILGQTFDALLPYSQIPAIIFSVNSSDTPDTPVINVKNWTLNGGTSDITLTGQQIAVIGTLTIVMNA